ncbi:MAG: cytochrome b/b6 domain-containing protein [Bacteroidales bacterium]
MTKERILFYPAWIRIWHIVNAVSCLFLIVTGLSMQYSNPTNPLIDFNTSVAMHNSAGIVLSVNYLIFLIGNWITPNGNHYKIQRKGFMNRLLNQFTYYSFSIFKGASAPYPINRERKFNPLQQFSYVFVMYIVLPLMFITGFALLFPGVVVNPFLGNNGLFVTDLLHVIAGFVVSLFLIIHVYFCTIGYTPLSHFKAMITGYHEVHE